MFVAFSFVAYYVKRLFSGGTFEILPSIVFFYCHV